MIDNIREKLRIIMILFDYCYDNKVDCRIDSESMDWISKAWCIAYEYIRNNNARVLTKDNLRYINRLIKKLIEILGIDEDKINFQYIKDKGLSVAVANESNQNEDTKEIKLWIATYKDLLKLIKENKND